MTDASRRALLDAIARSKGRDAPETAADDSDAFPFSAAARRAPWAPGALAGDDSIYLGRWTPKGLGKTFNVFAAAYEIKDTYLRTDRASDMFLRRFRHLGEDALRQGLKDGSYEKWGRPWVIPPLELLCGEDKDGVFITPDNLLAHQKRGAFKDSFNQPAGEYVGHWSCTTEPDGLVHAVDILSAEDLRLGQNNLKLNLRPVRFEEAKPA